MSQDIGTDYRARRYLVRQALSKWLATLPASGYAKHVTDCPACGARLHLERAPTDNGEQRMALCNAQSCVKLVM